MCLQHWLGLPILTEGGRCPVCQVFADPFGDHHVECGGNGDRIHGHNYIRDAMPIFTEGGRCPVCQVLADPFEDHHVECGGNGDRIHRHNSIRDAIFSAAQTAALVPRRELPSLIPGSQASPADIFLLSWDRGRPTALFYFFLFLLIIFML